MTGDAIGRLRHRLTIQQSVRAVDEGGGATLTWSDLADVWAEVTAQSGREIVSGDALTARRFYRVLMRYRADVDPTMRLIWNERVFEILSVRDEDGTQHWLTCDCEERGP